jgi:spermidine synthase
VRRSGLILGIFVLSGAAGLVYEVVWSRQLVLVFGNTTQAVATILTGFFGGMAIGSFVGGRLADRVRSPLRLYGLLELILVVVVILTPVTFRLLHEVYRAAFGGLETQPTLLALVRFGLALVALAPATIMMGATLPTLTRYLSGDQHLSRAFARLYAANTFGAILGTIAAGFFLIELLGLTGTLLVGAACSGIAGVAALVIDRRRTAAEAEIGGRPVATEFAIEELAPVPVGSDGPTPAARGVGRAHPELALLVAFVSGLTSLGYQTLWNRLLSSGTGNSTYIFSSILAIFLIGLVLGATAYAILRPRITRPILFLAVAQLAVALITVTGLVRVIGDPYALEPSKALETLWAILRPAVLVVLPATFVMGLSFPASSSLLADDPRRIATYAGRLLAVNTTGAIVGTFVIPFFLIPLIGSPASVGVLALVNLGLAGVLLVADTDTSRLTRVGTGLASAVVAVAILVNLVSPETRFVDPSIARIAAMHGTVYQSEEDEIASVQAADTIGKQLFVTGTAMTLLTVDAKLMPILPLMLRPDSTSAATVAFGMGSAFRAAVIAGLQTDAVELVPSVPKMFGWFYPDADEILSQPNGHVLITDGRNHLELTPKHYDIIVTDPPPPIESSGAAVISSLEYYQAGAAHLNPGGVMMQWTPYGGTVDEFLDHIRTFRAVFPNVIVAFGPGGYGFFLIGSDQPLQFTDENIRNVLARPGILEDISSAYDSPVKTVDGWAERIPQLIWIQGAQVQQIVGDGPLITDDRPLPEFWLLRRLFFDHSPKVSPNELFKLSSETGQVRPMGPTAAAPVPAPAGP